MIKDPFQEQDPIWSCDPKDAIYPSPVLLIVEDDEVEMATSIVDQLMISNCITVKGSGVMVIPRSVAASAGLVANYRLGYQVQRYIPREAS